MTIRTSIWIGDMKYDFETMEYEFQKECALKMKMQILKALNRKPKDSWLLKHPSLAKYWEAL